MPNVFQHMERSDGHYFVSFCCIFHFVSFCWIFHLSEGHQQRVVSKTVNKSHYIFKHKNLNTSSHFQVDTSNAIINRCIIEAKAISDCKTVSYTCSVIKRIQSRKSLLWRCCLLKVYGYTTTFFLPFLSHLLECTGRVKLLLSPSNSISGGVGVGEIVKLYVKVFI